MLVAVATITLLIVVIVVGVLIRMVAYELDGRPDL
jgi:hypothetical protein